MQKILLSFLLTGFLILCFSQNQRDTRTGRALQEFRTADKIYQQAEKLSYQSGNDESLQIKADSLYLDALRAFNALLPVIQNSSNDSLLFFVKRNTAFIHYYFDSIADAKKDYLAVIELKKKLPAIADSFLFLPFLYTGGFYYNQHVFDSAMHYYKMAEQLITRYSKPLQESQRLYNRLGVMYYEQGDYKQARNYFEKAIVLTDSADKTLLENYKINIASILIKLENYEEAKNLYLGLLPSPVFENEIYHNLAIISLSRYRFQEAIDYLRKINYVNNTKSIDLYYNLGAAFSGLNENDSAEFYLQRALAENLRWNGKRKNVQYGLILKYQGNDLSKQLLYKEALTQYQHAIMQFIPRYNEPDFYKNPEDFSGVFSYINLFNSLVAKGTTFESWYNQEKNIKLLEAALDAFQAAFKLAAYVEKTYDSDEARLFLVKIKHTVHNKPINICLLLFDLTKKKKFLQDAYQFDQQNKASALAFNVQQHELRMTATTGNELLTREAGLKRDITRLTISSAQLTDSIEWSKVYGNIRDKEIELSRIREKLNEDAGWKEKMSTENIPPVSDLQKKLDHTTALVSYHLSQNELLILLITQSRFEFHKSIIGKNFFGAIDSFKTSLHVTNNSQRYYGSSASKKLYEKLIGPVQAKLVQIKRLIIIPDDELHYLPFEALESQTGQYLVERFSVQYQYSTALLNRDSREIEGTGTLSFAPFSTKDFSDLTGTTLPILPASRDEIKNLSGLSFTDETATKENFIKNANRYSIVHLATHASVNNADPALSYIAFYPGSENFKLYAPEIANLRLDSTGLVILSACETGAGQLVKGEGLMSLSRAFAYAGCPDIITSLWKAEDRTTAFLTRQVHHYLEKKYTRDKALQQAKLDLLSSDKIDPRLKSPAYWAHLVFIGEYESRPNPANWWWIAISFIIGAILYKLIGKKKAKPQESQQP